MDMTTDQFCQGLLEIPGVKYAKIKRTTYFLHVVTIYTFWVCVLPWLHKKAQWRVYEYLHANANIGYDFTINGAAYGRGRK